MKSRTQFLLINDDVFTRIARRYDTLCDLFSFGLHRQWKGRLVATVNQEPYQRLLDIASGTGDIVYLILQTSTFSSVTSSSQPQYRVTDINTSMLELAKVKLGDYTAQVSFSLTDAHDMYDIASNSQDVVTISLGLKICNRQRIMREALRVLKPNGRLITLETSKLKINWMQRLYFIYLTITLPVLSWLVTGGDASSYRYLLAGIKAFPSAEALAQEMNNLGFTKVSFERLGLGLVALHQAYKPTHLK